MPDAQAVLFLVHVVSVAFLLGGLGTEAAWKVYADRTRDARTVAAAHDLLVRVDRLITGPSALLTFASGYVTIRVLHAFGGRIATAPFALWGLILMFVALAVWFLALRPIELKMADAADAAVEKGENLGVEYGRLSARWIAAWALTMTLLLVVAALMVFKPGGPGA